MDTPRKTNAAILVEQRRPLALAALDLPETLAPGQVLVRVRYSGICGSQLGEIDGVKGEDRFLPHLLGHEGSGEVLTMGPGVSHVVPGEKVVLHWRKGPGIEAKTPSYGWNGRPVNAGCLTTFSDYAVVSENRLTRIPQDSDLEVAALFGCAVTTGFGVVVNNARIAPGEAVLIYGAGGIGLNMVQAAAMVSAFPVIAVDLYDGKLALAERLGATHTINASRENVEQRIRQILDGVELDVFIDNTGKPSVIEAGYALTSPQGRLVLVGVPRKGDSITVFSLPLHFGKTLTGSHGGEATPELDIPRYHRLYSQGRLDLKSLITDRVPLVEINDAIERMRIGAVVGRCLIRM